MMTVREYRQWLETQGDLWTRHIESVHEYHAEHGYVTFAFGVPLAIGEIVRWAADPNMEKGWTLFEVISEGTVSDLVAQSATGWVSDPVRNSPYFYRVRAMD